MFCDVQIAAETECIIPPAAVHLDVRARMAVARRERRVRVRLGHLRVGALAVHGRRPVCVVPAHLDVVRRELADLR